MSQDAATQDAIHIETHDRPGEPILRARAPDPCALVIFGATGDLAQRKLLPALYNLHREGWLPEHFSIVAYSRSASDTEEFRRKARESVAQFSRTGLEEKAWAEFVDRIECEPGAFDDPAAYARLRDRLGAMDKDRQTQGNRLFYLATPASAFPAILAHLTAAGLISRAPGAAHRPWGRVVIEKPFGHDLTSARDLNRLLAEMLDESQVFRIDHYLGKETVQNILVFRFANSIFEPLWSNNYVDHVEITAAEELGVENRAKFYDETGVIRDMVQNHLLQVLALVAMEPPASFGAEDIRDEKSKIFRTIRPVEPGDVVVGQYRGYPQEKGVAPGSRTPTYVALKLLIDNWRWNGVPFYVRAGKRLAKRMTEVSIHFKSVPFCLFKQDDICQRLEPNVLTIRIQPKEGIALGFECKIPGEDLSVAGVTMDFNYSGAFHQQPQEAYERLLLDCMRGNATLFARRDAVEQAWALVTPVLEALEKAPRGPVAYEPGGAGPEEAKDLLRRDGRRWTAVK
ncbi:MAG TPA: glucose-6-phosphate dehydrogenase [Myxococcales bacterium]|nr:glucose-6-phosphate dehydrogenase [Myxococcales bacterium]